MKAEVTKDDFQWFINWLSNNDYLVLGITIPQSGRYDKISYSIEYDVKPVNKKGVEDDS